MPLVGTPSRFSACIVDLIFAGVSYCFWVVLSVLVNLVVASVSPSVFRLFFACGYYSATFKISECFCCAVH